jgi:hypothetical protein
MSRSNNFLNKKTNTSYQYYRGLKNNYSSFNFSDASSKNYEQEFIIRKSLLKEQDFYKVEKIVIDYNKGLENFYITIEIDRVGNMFIKSQFNQLFVDLMKTLRGTYDSILGWKIVTEYTKKCLYAFVRLGIKIRNNSRRRF